MMSGVVKYVVIGSLSVLVASNAVFGALGRVGFLELSLIFLGGMGLGASAAGLLYRLARIRRRRREVEGKSRYTSTNGYGGMAEPVSRIPVR